MKLFYLAIFSRLLARIVSAQQIPSYQDNYVNDFANILNEFDKALDELGIENEIYIYDGVGQAFANPSENNYAPKETEDAWIDTGGNNVR